MEIPDTGYKRIVVEVPAHVKRWLDEVVGCKQLSIKEYLIEKIESDYVSIVKENYGEGINSPSN